MIDTGVGLYILGCFGVGTVACKSLFNFLHDQDQSTLKTTGVAGLSILVGLWTAGLFMSLADKRTKRWGLPKCQECGDGRLYKKTETLESYRLPANIKVYHIRQIPVQDFKDVETPLIATDVIIQQGRNMSGKVQFIFEFSFYLPNYYGDSIFACFI